MKQTKKKLNILLVVIIWIFAILCVSGVCGYALWNYEISPVEKSVESEKTYRLEVSSGETVSFVARELKNAEMIHSEKALYFVARFNLFRQEYPFNLKSGVYIVKNTMTLQQIYDLLQSGTQEYISVSIPEGLTISKIGAILEQKGICSCENFKKSCNDTELLNEYGIPAENFEGYLFPDTYYLTPNMKGADVVRFMVDTFFERALSIESLKDISPERLHYILTLASIVEREYRVKEEAPIIASVFTNRLKYNIGLYSCATVEYVITEILGRPHPDRITYDDLKIDNPYNTYLWAGLTPGPISNPGLVALDAAANPAKTKYYYFVLTDPVKGTHTFSENFDQHKAAENTNYYSK